MEWQFVVALVISIPIIFLPAAFVWYLNLGGVYAAVKRQERQVAQNKVSGSAKQKARQKVTAYPPSHFAESRWRHYL